MMDETVREFFGKALSLTHLPNQTCQKPKSSSSTSSVPESTASGSVVLRREDERLWQSLSTTADWHG